MLRMALTCLRPGTDPANRHLPHVAPDGLTIHPLTFAPQSRGDAARTVERVLCVELINPMLDSHLARCRQHRVVVAAAAADREQIRLHG